MPATGTWTVTASPGGLTTTGTGTTTTFTGLAANTYTFTVTNSLGCISTASTSAVINAQPNTPAIVLSGNSPVCQGQTVTVSAGGGSNYYWSTGDTTSIIHDTPNTTTTYTVTVSNIYSCSATDKIVITVNSYPSVSLSSNLTGNIGYMGSDVTFNVVPSGYDSYQFVVNGTPITEGTQSSYEISSLLVPQTIYVMVGNKNCYISTDTLIINIKPIVNAFTPNGDAVNDVFLKGLNIKIFNRWGELLYEGTDGWNGKYNGKLVSPGTYFYIIKTIDKNNNPSELNGSVTVVVKY